MNELADIHPEQLARQIDQRMPVGLFRRTFGIMTHDGTAQEAGQMIRVYVYKGDTDRIDLQIAHDQLCLSTHITGEMARAMAAELVAAADAMDAAAQRVSQMRAAA